jgi:diguanylate cyclase (GGDEF)-like protein
VNQSLTNPEVAAALLNLEQLFHRVVRAEQLRDGLTSLANDEALVEWIKSVVDGDSNYWVAFVEVDRFKSVNDRFGYDAADDLLRSIGDQLRNAAVSFFGHPAAPFRAHGDEFFLAGLGDPECVLQALELLASNISALKISSPKGVMSCTVSTGWATRSDCELFLAPNPVTFRGVRDCLERAVAHAKRARGSIVRLDRAMVTTETRAGRADCASCNTKYDLVVPATDLSSDRMYCPNCGERGDRPHGLQPAEPAVEL